MKEQPDYQSRPMDDYYEDDDCGGCGMCDECIVLSQDFHEEMEKALALDQKKLEDLGAFEGVGHKVPRLCREHFRGAEGQRYGVDDPEER